MWVVSVCIIWESFEPQNSLFGVNVGAEYDTVPKCQQYCVDEPDCVAVDFNSIDKSCWVHLDARNLWENNTFALPNVTQYRISRVNCSGGTVFFRNCIGWRVVEERGEVRG